MKSIIAVNGHVKLYSNPRTEDPGDALRYSYCSSFPVSHKVGNVVNFVLGIEIKGIWSNSINLVLQLK